MPPGPGQLFHLGAGLASARDDGADALGDLPQRIDVEVSIAAGGRHLGMPEQLADDRQRRATRSGEAGIRVPQIVQP